MKNKKLFAFYLFVSISGSVIIETINLLNKNPIGIGMIYYWIL